MVRGSPVHPCVTPPRSHVLPGPRQAPASWPSSALIAGGMLNIALWPVYTTLHGPGSVDREGELLGLDALFWGSMMEGPSGLLLALGLAGSYRRLTAGGGRMARVGYVLTMIGVLIPALVNVVILAVMPPLLAPSFGAGLILLALAGRRGASLARSSRILLWGLGIILISSFLWLLSVRPHVLDEIDGYRIYGAVANVLFGFGWILFGFSLLTRRRGVGPHGPAVTAAPDV